MQRECRLDAYWQEERYPVLFFFVPWYSCSIIWYPGLWRIYCKHVKDFLNYFGFVNIRSQKLRNESHRLSLNNVSHYCFFLFWNWSETTINNTLYIFFLSMRKKNICSNSYHVYRKVHSKCGLDTNQLPLRAACAIREKRGLEQDSNVHDRAWVRQECCPMISVPPPQWPGQFRTDKLWEKSSTWQFFTREGSIPTASGNLPSSFSD